LFLFLQQSYLALNDENVQLLKVSFKTLLEE